GRVTRSIDAGRDVRAMIEEPDGSLWVGNQMAGLQLIRGSKSTTFPPARSLKGTKFHAITDDGARPRRRVNHHEIVRVSKRELLAYANGARTPIHPWVFGTADGLRSGDSSSGQPTSARAADGSMWFATKRGIAHLQPRSFLRPDVSQTKVL